VHGLLSLQLVAVPPRHVPPEQASPVVQAFPSSQLAVLLTVSHSPVDGLQESSVQPLPSLQTVGVPATQLPPEQASPTVHAFPSLQVAVLSTCSHTPVDGLQESSVHGLSSLQLVAVPPTHAPPEHASPVVHAFPSSQAAVLFTNSHDPVAGLQLSSVQALPSLQTVDEPGTHRPSRQLSPVVQAFPSLQALPVFGRCAQIPVSGTQASSVHGFPSSQRGPVPGTHAPPEQVSPVVQAFPSSQLAVLFAYSHSPVVGLHASSVQPLLSLQTVGVPATQLPPEQTSPTVQALPSLQLAVLLTYSHSPVVGLHASSVHALLSLQTVGDPATQLPPEQASPTVQALPSVQAAVLLTYSHSPVEGLHASFVQTLLSLHTVGVPATQVPPEQASPTVHALPSLQPAVLSTCWQPVAGLQESSVHGLPSSQFTGVLPHAPLWHASAVQASPSLQRKPSSTVPSQSLSSPSQTSGDEAVFGWQTSPPPLQCRVPAAHTPG